MIRHLPWILLPALVFLATACSPQAGGAAITSTSPAPQSAKAVETYADPFAYCAAVGTVDAPDARYAGEAVPDKMIDGFKKAAGLQDSSMPLEQFKKSTVWRCMDHKVYACNFGANLPCSSKANTDKTPTQAMADFCKANPNSDFIPMSVTSHDTIYSWRCVKDTPALLDQIATVDAAGYIANIWYELAPNP